MSLDFSNSWQASGSYGLVDISARVIWNCRPSGKQQSVRGTHARLGTCKIELWQVLQNAGVMFDELLRDLEVSGSSRWIKKEIKS